MRRKIGSSALVALLAALVALVGTAVVPATGASAGDRRAEHGHHKLASLTEQYVEEFYPLFFSFLQMRVDPSNSLIGPDKISHVYRGVVAINNDTLYASTPIDFVSQSEPVILTVPATSTELSYSVLVLDAYGNVYETNLRSKAAGSASDETVHALVPRGYRGRVPRDAVRTAMPFEFSILIFRVDRNTGTTNVDPEASAFRDNLLLQVLRDWRKDPTGGATNIVPEAAFAVSFKLLVDELIELDPIEYLRVLHDAVHSTNTPPLTGRARTISRQFDKAFGDGSDFSVQEEIALSLGARAAHSAIISNYLDHRDHNNWIHFTNMGEWGRREQLDRASISEYIQYGNNISTAAYYHTFRDGDGQLLNGSTENGYVLTFPAGELPPAARFWSLTAYTPDTIELIENPLEKYLVAGYTPGLQQNPNGSTSIYISRTQPDGVPEANWLPISDGDVNVMLRIYGVIPDSSVADNTYRPPAVVPYDPTG